MTSWKEQRGGTSEEEEGATWRKNDASLTVQSRSCFYVCCVKQELAEIFTSEFVGGKGICMSVRPSDDLSPVVISCRGNYCRCHCCRCLCAYEHSSVIRTLFRVPGFFYLSYQITITNSDVYVGISFRALSRQ